MTASDAEKYAKLIRQQPLNDEEMYFTFYQMQNRSNL